MPTTEKRKILCDDEGNEHKYIHITHNACDGLPMMRKIQGVLTGMIGGGLEAFSGQGSILDAKIDGSALKQSFEPLFDVLCGDRDFLTRLYSTTRRDGIKLGWTEIGIAYQANYGEFFEATYWIIMENFINPLRRYLFQKLSQDQVTSLTGRLKGLFETVDSTSSSGIQSSNESPH